MINKELFSTEPDTSKVRVTDSFWKNRMEIVRTKVLPYEWEALNDRIEGASTSHAVENFKIAAELTKKGLVGKNDKGTTKTEGAQAVDTGEGGFKGFVFQDSDIAKWIESVAYAIESEPMPQMEVVVESVIDEIEKHQQPDGYFNSYFISSCCYIRLSF